MKVRIYKDEWYPVYGIDEDNSFGKALDIPKDKIEWILKAEKEFIKTQDYLENIYKETT